MVVQKSCGSDWQQCCIILGSERLCQLICVTGMQSHPTTPPLPLICANISSWFQRQ